MPFKCSDGTATMEQTDIRLRDESLQSVLVNLLAFFRMMALIQPNRPFLPYETETFATLPIIRRKRHSKLDGDPTFQINDKYFLTGRRNGIIARMYDPKHQNFHIYGGAPRAGPRVDVNFTGRYPFRYNVVAALQFAVAIELIMGRPQENETIDKISNCRGYILPNMRWADKQLQTRNRGTYKWRLGEVPIPRPRLPSIRHRPQNTHRIRNQNNVSRGRWNKQAKPKTQMRMMRRLISSTFTKERRHSTTNGRQHRKLRNSSRAKILIQHLLTPHQLRQAGRTFSRYTSTSSIEHTIKPSGFK